MAPCVSVGLVPFFSALDSDLLATHSASQYASHSAHADHHHYDLSVGSPLVRSVLHSLC